MTDNHASVLANVSEEFKKGFNAGYLLAQHAPNEIKNISARKNKTDFLAGLVAGQKEFTKEMLINKITSTKSKSNEKEH